MRYKRLEAEGIREERQVHKKQLPYTIKPINHPREILEWRAEVEKKSVVEAAGKRERAIVAFKAPPPQTIVVMKELKPSIFQRIYRWCLNKFLDIEFN